MELTLILLLQLAILAYADISIKGASTATRKPLTLISTHAVFPNSSKRINNRGGKVTTHINDASYKSDGNISEGILLEGESDEDIESEYIVILSPEEILVHDGKKLVKADDEKLDKLNSRTIITLAACGYASYGLSNAVNAFNRQNEDIRIYLKVYREEDQSGYYPTQNAALNQDIVKGDIPDIILLDNMDVSDYIRNGLFTDHGKLIDEYSGYKTDELSQNFVKAVSYRDSLFTIPLNFQLTSLITAEDFEKWDYKTLEEITEREENAFRKYTYPFEDILMVYLSEHVDMANGTCDFDNDSFRSVLKTGSNIPATDYDEYEYEESEKYFADIENLTSIYEYNSYLTHEYVNTSETPYEKGFPTEDGTGKILAYPQMNFSVTEACQNKKEAMDCIMYFASSEYINTGFDLSFLGSDVEGRMEYALSTDEISEEIVSAYNEFIRKPCFSDMLYRSVFNIVSEETSRYFSGELTADETAASVQKKVSLYLSETA